MGEFNINEIKSADSTSKDSGYAPTPVQKDPQYGMAILAGIGAAVLIAIILAVLAIALESEYSFAVVLGEVLVGFIVRNFVPEHSIGGAIIGAIVCPATYFIYQVILAICGYSYEKDGEFTFWIMLIGSVLYGAYVCYSKMDDNQ